MTAQLRELRAEDADALCRFVADVPSPAAGWQPGSSRSSPIRS